MADIDHTNVEQTWLQSLAITLTSVSNNKDLSNQPGPKHLFHNQPIKLTALGTEKKSYQLDHPLDSFILRHCASRDELKNVIKASRIGLTPQIKALKRHSPSIIWTKWGQATLNQFLQHHPESACDIIAPLNRCIKNLSSLTTFSTRYDPCRAIRSVLRSLSPSRHHQIINRLESLMASYDLNSTMAVHGDLHGDNILITHHEDSFAFRFIDFSFSGYGDPLWDQATLCFDQRRHHRSWDFSDQYSCHADKRWPDLICLSGWLSYLWFRLYNLSEQASQCRETLLSLCISRHPSDILAWKTIFSLLGNR